jgi:hypothetical protein
MAPTDVPPAYASEGLACGSKELSTSPPQHPGSLVTSDPP